VGHNSLNAIRGALLLPDVSYEDVSTLIDGINQLTRSLALIVRNIAQRHEPVIQNQDWVWRLIEVLKKGVTDP
jgi:hypothetical protein